MRMQTLLQKLVNLLQYIIPNLLLFGIVICAFVANFIKLVKRNKPFGKALQKVVAPKDEGELNYSKHYNDVGWYIEKYGFCCENHEVVTQDGWVLSLQRIVDVNSSEKGESSKIPVLLQHGLFQSSGIFVVNEEDSMAFKLAEQGFDVWLGNNRGVYDQHENLNPSDNEYWEWGLDELGAYDFPALVSYVSEYTGKKVMYVGHSQGNAQGFVGLSIDPSINNKLAMFVALAPAYYVNPFENWVLKGLSKMGEGSSFYYLFGNNSFVPSMCQTQKLFPTRIFCSMAYNMFEYLFNWSDHHWKKGRKPKYFTTTPRPLSCKLIMHWLDVSRFGVLSNFETHDIYGIENIACPVSVLYGGDDSLVSGDKLVKDMLSKNIDLRYHEELEGYEHMDLIWAKDSNKKVTEKLIRLFNDVY
eukprot:TRINITY_DN4558_c0_g1_i1.p1 TRINITY_DN4558_c0_g1~~TRINITY_DN4558_c0_g1_i1.p1  ORF type:complete len:429 (+),score=62.90 TRINITY_DN4558_c0_g1_i1:46-1287(+)